MKHTKRGFTLIELLVVISIISLMSSVVLTALQDARGRSRDAKRIETLIQVQRALELYYHDNNQYPSYTYAYSTLGSQCGAGSRWCSLETALSPYLSKLPRGESGITWYYDTNSGDGYTSYGLMTQFESTSYNQKESSDGGYASYTAWYEVGAQPQYCNAKGRNWLANSAFVCNGSN